MKIVKIGTSEYNRIDKTYDNLKRYKRCMVRVDKKFREETHLGNAIYYSKVTSANRCYIPFTDKYIILEKGEYEIRDQCS